jgi:hypothetical protein
VVRYYVASGVAGGNFARGNLIAGVQDHLEAVGAEDVSFEIVSGVLVGVGFALEAKNADAAVQLAREILWTTSFELVGLLSVSELDAIALD